MSKNVLFQGKAIGLARSACLVLGVASVLGCYWGVGIVLGPIAFLLATRLSSREGHIATDIGGIAALVGFALSLALGVPRFGNTDAVVERGFGARVDSRFEAKEDWIGKGAPDFELVDIAGATHRLSDYEGQRVFVLYWAVWCQPCLQEIPHLISLVEELPREDFQIIGVSSDPELGLEKTVEKTGINYPVVSLSTVGNEWGEPYNLARFLPTLTVVSPEGRLEGIHVGGLSKGSLYALARGEK